MEDTVLISKKDSTEKIGKISFENLNIPKHIAIIMDGNRRWAKNRGRGADTGHKEGYKRFSEISDICKKIGVKTVTIYALSGENLRERSKKELALLFRIMRSAIIKEEKRFNRENIKLNVLGRKEGLSDDLIEAFSQVEENTKGNTGGILNIALNYGGRTEIVDAIKKIVKKNISSDDINEETISENLYTKDQVDPDLVIRTGGKIRTSNFLPWQTTYAEYYFTDTLWPDFNASELKKSLEFFNKVQRNFGV